MIFLVSKTTFRKSSFLIFSSFDNSILYESQKSIFEIKLLALLELGKKEKWQVTDLKTSEQKRQPRAPFTTSTLQQTASTRLGFSPSRTMQVAQKLYEQGFITYMRTDSTNLSKQAQGQILSLINKKYGLCG